MSVKIINAGAVPGIQSLPDESIDCIVTSPPYFGLRDYGIEGQIGLEETPELFIDRLIEIFEECRRVLKPAGVCFVNLGDSYSGGNSREQIASSENREKTSHMQSFWGHGPAAVGLIFASYSMIRSIIAQHAAL